MKFKLIFFLFNIVILFSFLLIVFMPLAMLGAEFTKEFWTNNWYLPLLFVAVIGGLNSYFIANWKLFTYLEKEDWPSLLALLETKIFKKKRIRKGMVRLLINASLMTSKPEMISRLEALLKEEKPAYLNQFILPLGLPYILKNDPSAMSEYFGRHLEYQGDDRGWILWNYCFAKILEKDLDAARPFLMEMSQSNRSPIFMLMTCYLMEAYPGDEEISAIMDGGYSHLRENFTRNMLKKEAAKQKENLQIAVFLKMILEAIDKLYDPASGTPSQSQSPEVLH